ncbi:hypothetical protein Mag101_16775 [Microbulbifer agarilyticus]|uniref:DUF4124 domain-containing protein n=1 Tax=Microbulbifer agarilyticus TaxID=260552 RepID=A0A1Q2M8T4_9GAMM|nr:DUF4124 domain-containing protein [Microbulbifer agarilyticus]AQQ69096.1 hypothetical protein Mag101_16775 [Microbulbifer agarilyticus]
MNNHFELRARWFVPCVLALCVFTNSPVIAGELYRWVDENGKVHFGDRPPAEAKAESLEGQLKPVNSADPTRRQDFPNNTRKNQIDQEYAARKQAEKAKQQRAQQKACDYARKQLKILKGPVYFVDAEGNESTISERQRVAEARKLEAQIRRNCG